MSQTIFSASDRYQNRSIVAAANVGYVPGDPSTYLDMPFSQQDRLFDDGVIRGCSADAHSPGIANATSGGSMIGSLGCAAPPQLADFNQASPSVCLLNKDASGRWKLKCKTNVTIA